MGVGYAVVAVAYFGRPILAHPERSLLGTDNELYAWSFAWWPHALGHGLNPLTTHALYAPAGANLAWVTAIPSLALPFAPVTLIFGPIAAVNAAALLLPAIAAWSAYRLCLALTASTWASLVGGYLYGFSSFALAQQLAIHVNLTADFALPLLALSLVRYVRGDWSQRRFVLSFGVLVAIQLGISTEVTLTLSTMLLLALLVSIAFVRSARPAIRRTLRPIGAGYLLGGILASPLLLYAALGASGQGFVNDPAGTDLLNLFVPTNLNAIAGSSFSTIQGHFNPHESALFVGTPALVVIALFAWRERRNAWSRVLLALFALATVFALGPRLVVDGDNVAPLPWDAIDHLPGYDDVHTPGFGAFVALAVAVIVAVWTGRSRGRVFTRPYALPLLSVFALVPAFWHAGGTLTPARPSFFTSGAYASCVHGDTVAVFPFDATANAIQVETHFAFPIAGGYLTPLIFGTKPVVSFNSDPTVFQLNFYGDRGRPSMDALLAFARRHDVGRIVRLADSDYPTTAQLRQLGPVEQTGGVAIAPACGTPALTRRPLPASARIVLQEQANATKIQWCLDGYVYQLPAGLDPGNLLEGATKAVYVQGRAHISCDAPPDGFVQRGYAPTRLHVPPGTYPYYVRG